VLDEYGLVAALNSYIEKFEKRYEIHVEFTKSDLLMPRLGAALEMTLLRIAQEALLNIARHAQADHVALTLQCEENVILLTIEDNGVGISAVKEGSNGEGHGLMIMRERAEAVGGTLVVSSVSGNGTRIEASLPFQSEAKNNRDNEVS
jgi:signal transduction histidine kinase